MHKLSPVIIFRTEFSIFDPISCQIDQFMIKLRETEFELLSKCSTLLGGTQKISILWIAQEVDSGERYELKLISRYFIDIISRYEKKKWNHILVHILPVL